MIDESGGELNDFLTALQSGEGKDSPGRFTVEPEKALLRLSHSLCLSPHLYVLRVVAGAAALGATCLEVRATPRETVFEFDGQEIPPVYLDQFLHRALDGKGPPGLRHLAMAVNLARGLRPRWARLESGASQITLTCTGDTVIYADAPRASGPNRLVVSFRRWSLPQWRPQLWLDQNRPHFRFFLQREPSRPHCERRALRDGVIQAGMAVTVQGEPVPHSVSHPPSGMWCHLDPPGRHFLRLKGSGAPITVAASGDWEAMIWLQPEEPGVTFLVGSLLQRTPPWSPGLPLRGYVSGDFPQDASLQAVVDGPQLQLCREDLGRAKLALVAALARASDLSQFFEMVEAALRCGDDAVGEFALRVALPAPGGGTFTLEEVGEGRPIELLPTSLLESLSRYRQPVNRLCWSSFGLLPVEEMLFSPDGRWLAVSGRGVQIIEVATGHILATLPEPHPAMRWSGDSQKLATLSSEGLKRWEMRAPLASVSLPLGAERPVDFLWAPDNENLITAGPAGIFLGSFQVSSEKTWKCLALSHCGRLLAARSNKGVAVFLLGKAGEPLWTMKVPNWSGLSRPEFTPQGNLIVEVGGSIWLLDGASGRLLTEVGRELIVLARGAGRLLAGLDRKGWVWVWEASGHLLHRWQWDSERPDKPPSDASLFFLSGQSRLVGHAHRTGLRSWSLDGRREAIDLYMLNAEEGNLHRVLPDGPLDFVVRSISYEAHLLRVLSPDGPLAMWDGLSLNLARPAWELVWSRWPSPPAVPEFSACGDYLRFNWYDCHACLLELRSGIFHELSPAAFGTNRAYGQGVGLCWSCDESPRLWRLPVGPWLGTLPVSEVGDDGSVAFSLDSRHLALVHRGGLQVWHSSDGQWNELHLAWERPGSFGKVVWSENRLWVRTRHVFGRAGRVLALEGKTGRCLAEFPVEALDFLVLGDQAFYPTGRFHNQKGLVYRVDGTTLDVQKTWGEAESVSSDGRWKAGLAIDQDSLLLTSLETGECRQLPLGRRLYLLDKQLDYCFRLCFNSDATLLAAFHFDPDFSKVAEVFDLRSGEKLQLPAWSWLSFHPTLPLILLRLSGGGYQLCSLAQVTTDVVRIDIRHRDQTQCCHPFFWLATRPPYFDGHPEALASMRVWSGTQECSDPRLWQAFHRPGLLGELLGPHLGKPAP